MTFRPQTVPGNGACLHYTSEGQCAGHGYAAWLQATTHTHDLECTQMGSSPRPHIATRMRPFHAYPLTMGHALTCLVHLSAFDLAVQPTTPSHPELPPTPLRFLAFLVAEAETIMDARLPGESHPSKTPTAHSCMLALGVGACKDWHEDAIGSPLHSCASPRFATPRRCAEACTGLFCALRAHPLDLFAPVPHGAPCPMMHGRLIT